MLLLSACGNAVVNGANDQPMAPQITTQPASQSVAAGSTATFSVTAGGSAPLSYQWLRDGSPINGAIAATYTTATTTATDNGVDFSVTVTNAEGSVTSVAAMLAVTETDTAPSIIEQPAAQSVVAGSTAAFAVSAIGTAPLTYQWSKNGAPVSGATAPSYTTPATQLSDSGAKFAATVSNSAGSAISAAAVLTVSAAPSAPTIVTQPANQTVPAGATATFSVAATGTAPLSYQWFKGGTAISGATAASYTTPATVNGDNGSIFTVQVSNAAGSANSNAAMLNVQAAASGVDVVTYHNDVMRSGQNVGETVLTPANVNQSTFGLLRKLPVDGNVDAQPLTLSSFSIGGAIHNHVVYVATERDSVYAFDADSGAQLWQVSLLGSGESPSDERGCNQIVPEIGVTSTPAIDRVNNRMYVVAMSKDGAGNYYHRIHSLNLQNGADLVTPVSIAAQIAAKPGEPGTVNGNLVFQAGRYVERSALLVNSGNVYTSFTSHCDSQQYTGWVIAYDAATLAQKSVYNDELGGGGGGSQGAAAFWNAGSGPSADSSGNIYVMSGNGTFDTSFDGNGFPARADYGNSIIKLGPPSGGTQPVLDYFTMFNSVAESANDQDLGSGGLMLLPDLQDGSGATRHLAVGAGKDQIMYVVDRDNLGKFNAAGNSNAYQAFSAFSSSIFGAPVYFNGTLYYGPINAAILAFPVANAKVATAAGTRSTMSFGYPGAVLSLSANGTSNAILWAMQSGSVEVLYALDAASLAELYDSSQAGSRDQLGAGSKWTPATVANGLVLVATQANSSGGSGQNYIGVYGLH